MAFKLSLLRPARAAFVALSFAAAVGLAPRAVLGQGTLSALDTDVDQIARLARPSVVTVITQNEVERRDSRTGGQRTYTRTRVGSGVAVEENVILTTASVVSGAERLWIRTTNGLQVEAQIAGRDPIFNVALLRVPDLRLPPLKFSTEGSAREGDWVMAIGTSHYRAQITQSVGSIAYRHREPRFSLLELTNTVYPGYSGGAVLNARGELIGIVQGETGAADPGSPRFDEERRPGASIVLSVETVRPVYEQIRRQGRVHHGYLGVSTRGATVESDTERGLSVPIGALIESVVPDAPAARASLRRGDLIVGFERERVEYPEQLARWVAATPPGGTVELVWVRDDIQHIGKVVLAESPDAAPQWALSPSVSESQGPAHARITELERQIQRLSRELERLKNGTASTPH